MRSARHSFAISIVISFYALAQPTSFQDSFLDHMVGKWVLRHQHIQIQEVSRDKNAENKPAYEATILIGREPQSGEYRCLWLDNTGPWDFTSQGIGRAKRGGEAITFRFGSSDGSSINTTFSYDKNDDAWQWSIDNEADGKARAFARVRLTRQ